MRLRCMLWFCAGLLQVAALNAQSGSALFADRDLKWEAGPPDLGYQTAVGAVTFFRRDGAVLRLSCELYRDSETSPLAIELKSGYTARAGHWRLLDGGKVEVRLRLVVAEKTAAPANTAPTIPGDEKTEVWAIVDGQSPLNAREVITTQGEQHRLRSLKNRSEFDRLVKRYLR